MIYKIFFAEGPRKIAANIGMTIRLHDESSGKVERLENQGRSPFIGWYDRLAGENYSAEAVTALVQRSCASSCPEDSSFRMWMMRLKRGPSKSSHFRLACRQAS